MTIHGITDEELVTKIRAILHKNSMSDRASPIGWIKWLKSRDYDQAAQDLRDSYRDSDYIAMATEVMELYYPIMHTPLYKAMKED